MSGVDQIMRLADEWYAHGQTSHSGIDEKYAALRAAIERVIAENLQRGNVIGRISAHLLGNKNNVSDEDVVIAAAEVGRKLQGALLRIERGGDRPCTCHPDDNPPVPCPQKYALSECRAAAPPAVQAEPVLLNLALRLRLARRCLKQAISSGANQSYIDQLRGAETEAWNSFQAAKAIAAPPAVQGEPLCTCSMTECVQGGTGVRCRLYAAPPAVQAESVAYQDRSKIECALIDAQDLCNDLIDKTSGISALRDRLRIALAKFDAAHPADDEAVRLLRAARSDVDYALINSSGKGRSARADLLVAIDAYLARVGK